VTSWTQEGARRATAASTADEPVVVVRDLTKRYGAVTAVDAVSFAVRRGGITGLLGPNGAGKSTTMRMIYQVTPPTSGALMVFGLETGRDSREIKSRLGVVPQMDNLDEELPVLQNLLIFAAMNGSARSEARERAHEALRFVELGARAGASVQELSGGMKRRLTLARGLMNDPELLILDEPTTGLDPQVRLALWEKLDALRDRGMTILMSTHYMDEAERLCDELLIMDHGTVIAEGAPRTLIHDHLPAVALELRLARGDAERAQSLRALTGARMVNSGGRATLWVDDGAAALAAAHREGLAESRTWLRPTNLEDVFLSLTGHSLREH
jgi:lipooligosaccharide transport system ATP-binding protein